MRGKAHRVRPPTPTARLRIGLLGGSFDPPHRGHVHISLMALKRLRLDYVWWLVSPGNPLKQTGPADLSQRMAACAELIHPYPKLAMSDIEQQLETCYTADTLVQLTAQFPQARFIWLMGADNLSQIHRWHHWRRIFYQVPIAVLPRPHAQPKAGISPAARCFAGQRLPEFAAPLLPDTPHLPCWCLLEGQRVPQSSTSFRLSGKWP